MGFVKKIGREIRKGRDKLTGVDQAKVAQRKAQEEAERKAIEDAKIAAAAEAAKTAGTQTEPETQVGAEETKSSNKKKKLKGGKKSLSIARSSGSGINL